MPWDSSSLQHHRYERSNGYDSAWVVENQMGPNALWLAESLSEVMTIEPGMKVLDLGCGRAMTSVFLAREFEAEVWASDLWIAAEDNRHRVMEAGLADRVTAVHAEAHALPFESGFFDAIVSFDAYQYFGTADLYLGYILDFLKPGGQLGVVMPATTREWGADFPPKLERFFEWDFCCWHTPQWWRTHWTKTRKVDVHHAEFIEDGWRDWLQFNDYIASRVEGWWIEECKSTHEFLMTDQGEEVGFVRVVASKR